jgi:hypothetical protein
MKREPANGAGSPSMRWVHGHLGRHSSFMIGPRDAGLRIRKKIIMGVLRLEDMA